jgi:hypothetical protein
VRTGTQLIREPHDLRVRRKIELLLNERLMNRGVANGAIPIARGGERLHEPDRDTGVDRVFRRQATPPDDGRRVIATRLRGERTLLECGIAVMLERAPLFVYPALELARAGEMEAVEKWSTVESRGTLIRARLERLLELGDIAREDICTKPEVAHSHNRIVGPEVSPQHVHCLRQQAASTLLVGIRPEVTNDLFTRDPPVTRPRQ